MTNEEASCTFRANDHENGRTWITLKPDKGGLPVLRSGILILYLNEEIGIGKAKEIARLLNDIVEVIEYVNT
jgi:hypothetical protein